MTRKGELGRPVSIQPRTRSPKVSRALCWHLCFSFLANFFLSSTRQRQLLGLILPGFVTRKEMSLFMALVGVRWGINLPIHQIKVAPWVAVLVINRQRNITNHTMYMSHPKLSGLRQKPFYYVSQFYVLPRASFLLHVVVAREIWSIQDGCPDGWQLGAQLELLTRAAPFSSCVAGLLPSGS